MRRSGLEFVVTGTGRSGTGFASEIFTAAGLPCGHEQYFRIWPGLGEVGEVLDLPYPLIRRPYHQLRETMRRRGLGLAGDASWMAVPRLPRRSTVSLLQLRHPAKVVRSFLGTQFFTDMNRHHQQRSYALRFFKLTGEPIDDALRWWLYWNETAAKHADVIYALESVDATLFAGLLDRLGQAEADDRAVRALTAVQTDVNSSQRRGDAAPQLAWEQFPDTPSKLQVQRMAESWGYDVLDESVIPESAIYR